MTSTPPPAMALSTANWHWKNKNVTAWAKTWFQKELADVSVTGEGQEEAHISEVTYVEGDVELGQRKSKLITIYDCKVEMKWSGTTSDGTPVEGRLTVPEVSHEVTLDGLSDYVYDWTLSTSSSPTVDAVFKLAKSRLPTALETKFAEFPTAIVETHSKDIQVSSSAQPSRAGTPAPPAAASSSTSTPAAAGSGSSTPATKKKPTQPKGSLNTTMIVVDATFMASADDLYSLLTDEKRIPLWSRAPAQSSATPDSGYSLFGGGVKGTYILLTPPTEIIQTWGLQSPTWPDGHFGTLTTTFEQSTDSTKITWSLAGVPLGIEDEITRNIQGYYVHGLKSIGYVQVTPYVPSPSSSLSSAQKRPAASGKSSAMTSQAYVAVAIAVLALAASFTLPYFK